MKHGFLYRLCTILILLFIVAGTALMGFLFYEELPVIWQEANGRVYAVVAACLGAACYAGALLIAVTLLRMLHSLGGDPFVTANVNRLRLMGFVALGMTACTLGLVALPFNAVIFVAGGMAVGLCGLLALVLSEVFARAVAYKQENDLTI